MACSKGPALADHDEKTSTGETLILVLLLYFFCLKRLMHFGSPPVKLVASYCLLELLTSMSDQRCCKFDELECSVGYLMSMLAVLGGLIFDSDFRIAVNCGLCISLILGWETQETRVTSDNKWSKLVVEELVMSFTAPGLASSSFTNQLTAAIHVAVALLRLKEVPKWMTSVFNSSCISGIVRNLSASGVCVEMVEVFRMLMVSDFLDREHIEGLNRVFQVCRKHVYTEDSQENSLEESIAMVVSVPDDLGKVFKLLIHFMSSDSSSNMASRGTQKGNRKLLEEIEMFLQESSKRITKEKSI